MTPSDPRLAAVLDSTTHILLDFDGPGRPVAIVSNNSVEAIQAYLKLHGLAALVAHVQGRDPRDPHLRKPHPHPLHEALAALGAEAAGAVLIGDSLTDIEAARAAGIRVIAYVNRPRKTTELADADALVSSMQTLAPAMCP